MKALLTVLLMVLVAGCSRNAPGPAQPAKRLSVAEFFQRIYLPGYQEAGLKDPKWDREARSFLSVLSDRSSGKPITGEQIQSALKEVQSVDCKDPLVRYMILRNTKDPHYAGVDGTNNWVQVAFDLDAAGYHLYWRFFSFARAAQALKSVSPETNSPGVVWFRNEASFRLHDLVQDHTLPTEVMFDAVYPWLITDLWGAPKLRMATWDRIEPTLANSWGDTAEFHLIRGALYVEHAWDARGGGWASTVSEEGWKQMRERLKIARECLEKSWSIKPRLETAQRMQWVEVGASQGREEMERWFKNAMELDPGNYTTCKNKLQWLHAKWHGSAQDMLAFGEECLSNTNGTVSLVLYGAHQELAKYHEQSGGGPADEYWKRPGVWTDVKRAFETFFAAHPEETGWRHNYAWVAYKAEEWEELRAQIPLLGPINYSYFGGKEAFEEMVRKAQEKGRPGAR